MISILKFIVTKLGGVDTSEENHIDTFTENRIVAVSGFQIASSENGGIWVEFQEISDYKFMNIKVIGKQNLKSLNGCELKFYTNNSEIILVSDTREIESDFSNVSNRYITEINFNITEQDTKFIENKEANKVEIILKKNKESFDMIK